MANKNEKYNHLPKMNKTYGNIHFFYIVLLSLKVQLYRLFNFSKKLINKH